MALINLKYANEPKSVDTASNTGTKVTASIEDARAIRVRLTLRVIYPIKLYICCILIWNIN